MVTMLHEFVTAHRDDLIRRCRVKVETRSVPVPTPAELEYGVPRFLDQLVGALRNPLGSSLAMDLSAALHGRDLQLQGFTVSQVVHDYGDVCQSITDLAVETGAPISVEDFRTLNRCLDDAIASAVTEFSRERTPTAVAKRDEHRVGFLVHEVRNLVNTAVIAFEVLNVGNVGVRGSTGAVLGRSLGALRDLMHRSIAEIRRGEEIIEPVRILVSDLIADLHPAAAMEAERRGLRLEIQAGEPGVTVLADRQILAAVVVNLLQNAFKFTRPLTCVTLRVAASAERVRIEIADECGGLPEDTIEGLFRPFEQRDLDRSGLGLGLAFSRWGAAESGGRIHAHSVPGHGCVFAVDLPRVPAPVPVRA
jgi:signal transduction histidine kinase